ncbi:MAG: 3-keto-5-aminohexanoate cleavage protein [Spirochaetia bacterium]|nr:3-keto-5-aminohexanoate cleavage protein [Spirochaetia bacterium]
MHVKRPIIISLAPVGFWENSENVPLLTPSKIANEVEQCVNEGAAMVHLHVRNERGEASTDMEVFNATVEAIQKNCDVVVQGSTGGVKGLTAKERCVVLQSDLIEMASLNMGSTNFFDGVYINSPSDIRYWASEMKNRSVVPELELFSLTMVTNTIQLIDEGLLAPPPRFGLCMGIPGAIPLDPRFIFMATQLMPEDAVWGLMLHGKTNPKLIATALSLGAAWIRVGFEDSPVDVYGRKAAYNAELVKPVRKYIELLGYTIADTRTARRILRIEE